MRVRLHYFLVYFHSERPSQVCDSLEAFIFIHFVFFPPTTLMFAYLSILWRSTPFRILSGLLTLLYLCFDIALRLQSYSPAVWQLVLRHLSIYYLSRLTFRCRRIFLLPLRSLYRRQGGTSKSLSGVGP